MNISAERALVRERRVKLAFFLGSLFLLFLVLAKVPNTFVSFILAFVTYYLLSPLVDFLEQRGLSRTNATTIPFLFTTLLIGISVYVFMPLLTEQVKGFQDNLPRFIASGSQFIKDFESKFGSLISNIYPIDLTKELEPKLTEWSTEFLAQMPQYISQSLTVSVLAPLFAFFMLLDGRDFVRSIISFIPNNFFELILNLNHQIGSQMGGFIRARLLESVIVGLIIWIGLLILGFPYALILALFAAILNVIPYLGPVIGALPAFIIAFANGGDSSQMIWLLVIYFVAQVIDTVILVPFLVAKIVNLHPITVILSIMIGSQVMGIIGMIICIPVVSALKVTSIAIYKHFTNFRN